MSTIFPCMDAMVLSVKNSDTALHRATNGIIRNVHSIIISRVVILTL